MGKYSSKRVLQLGYGALSSQNIEYLKANEAYVIVADKSFESINRYQKKVDELVELNIDNYDEVIAFCKANNIDAVLTDV